MTEDAKRIARMQAWERYEETKKELAVHRSKFRTWETLLNSLANRLQADPSEHLAVDYSKLPSYEDFRTSIAELNLAKDAYSRAYQEAKSNGFPVD